MSALKVKRISVTFAAIIMATAVQFMIRITPTFAEAITYSYDSLNRLTMIKYYDSLFIVKYTYDAAGNRISTKAFMDSDMDGLPSELEDTTCTDPNDPDTDHDGILDGDEDANANGVVDQGETDPCNPDSDGDGYADGLEVQAGSSPTDNTSNPGIIYVCQDGTCSGKRPCRATVNPGVGAALVNATLRITGGTYAGFTMDKALALTFQGGWNEGFTGRTGGASVISGTLTIQRGTIIPDAVVVKQ